MRWGLISRGNNRKDEFNGQTSSVADCVVQRGYLSGARDRGLSRRLFEEVQMTIKSILTTSLICSAVALATVGSASAQWYNQGELPNPGERYIPPSPQLTQMYDTAGDILPWPFNRLS